PPIAVSSLSLHAALPISASTRLGSALLAASIAAMALSRRCMARLLQRSLEDEIGPRNDQRKAYGMVDRQRLLQEQDRKASEDREDRKSTRLNSSHVKISY